MEQQDMPAPKAPALGKRPFSRRARIALILAAAVLLLCGGLLLRSCLRHRAEYVRIAGAEYPRNAEKLDLRRLDLTPEGFEEFRAAFPEAELRWMVPLSGGARDSSSVAVRIGSLTLDDIPLFSCFPALETVSAAGCEDYDLLLTLQNAREDLRVLWTVPLAGHSFRQDCELLSVPVDTAPEELAERLAWLPSLREVTLTGGTVPYETQDLLTGLYPELAFRWNCELGGRVFSSLADTVSFAGDTLTVSDLRGIEADLFRFPRLQRLDFTGCGLDTDALGPLAEANPELTVVWTMELYGVTVSTDAVEIDLSRRDVRDGGAAVESVLPYFRHLKKVDMSYCGISNEEMDALDLRHEDVRFVWTVFFSIYSLKTDATNFIAARFVNKARLYSGECWVLRYCRDLQALDLGHKDLTDLSFLYELPKLKYLILVENDIRDITPIGSLQDLIYLEIFWTKVEDLSPLINCKNLLDLNICYIYSKPDRAFDVLMQMPWLERLWYCGNALSDEQIGALVANMPNCEMYMLPHGESTGGTWRTHPRYYEMRDFFEMYYMEGGTNGVDDHGGQITVRG